MKAPERLDISGCETDKTEEVQKWVSGLWRSGGYVQAKMQLETHCIYFIEIILSKNVLFSVWFFTAQFTTFHDVLRHAPPGVFCCTALKVLYFYTATRIQ